MRIISGTAGGRRLLTPPGLSTRPIPDRAKTAVFNMIAGIRSADGQPAFAGTRVLDLYAGSGAFGLECLSRGSAEVVFVERARAAVEVLHRNLANLEFEDRATVVRGDALAYVGSLGASVRFDLAFCDPPYSDDPWSRLLPSIPAALLVAHTEDDLLLTEPWVELRRRSYGRPHIVVARHVQS